MGEGRGDRCAVIVDSTRLQNGERRQYALISDGLGEGERGRRYAVIDKRTRKGKRGSAPRWRRIMLGDGKGVSQLSQENGRLGNGEGEGKGEGKQCTTMAAKRLLFHL